MFPEIQSLAMAGCQASASNNPNCDFCAVGSALDAFNNSRDDAALPFQSPSTQPEYCKTEMAKKARKGGK